MCLKEKIKEHLIKIIEENDIPRPEINDDTVLLNTGLDSLGFAILVTELEEKLGYDPFVKLDEAVYPKTFLDFVSIYEKNRKWKII